MCVFVNRRCKKSTGREGDSVCGPCGQGDTKGTVAFGGASPLAVLLLSAFSCTSWQCKLVVLGFNYFSAFGAFEVQLHAVDALGQFGKAWTDSGCRSDCLTLITYSRKLHPIQPS